jgi:CubicO group peptidase (beta-lactamase class C family)
MDSKLQAALQQHLQDIMKTKHVKHAILAVESMDGTFKWSGVEGIADPEGTAMTLDTPFCIASITKLYIATAILKLQEQGHLSIDQSIAAYLPSSLIEGLYRIGNEDHTEIITVRNLLGHSSGLPDYLEIRTKDKKSIFDIAIEDGDRSWSKKDFADIVRDFNSPHFEPQPLKLVKKKVRYSDTNYQMLIAVIEEVTGKPLHEVFQELIYEPLGIKHTYHPGREPNESVPKAAMLWYKDHALDIPKALYSFSDLNSTMADLLVFMRALIRGNIFSDLVTNTIMWREWNQFGFSLSPIGPGWPIEYGLGIMRFRFPRFMTPIKPLPEVIGHTGVTGSWVFYSPPLDIMIAGNVSQVTASALPFRQIPRILRSLQTHYGNS